MSRLWWKVRKKRKKSEKKIKILGKILKKYGRKTFICWVGLFYFY